MTRWLKPFLPAEHGSWGILISAYLLGAFSIPFHPIPVIGMGMASLGIFLLRGPAVRLLRSGLRHPGRVLSGYPWPGWLICFGLVGVGSIPLLWLHRWALAGAALAALTALIIEARSIKSNPCSRMASEVSSALAVSLLAPATAYAATGRLGWHALTLWVLCTLYFGLTTVEVRWRVARLYQGRGLIPVSRVEQAARDRRVAWVAGALLAALYWSLAPVPVMIALALVPLAYRALKPAVPRPQAAPDIRQLGWREVRLSFVFVGLGAGLMRWF